MHRPTVGLIALVLLTGAAGCYLFGWASGTLYSAFWRVGVVMALLWLALPELLRVRSKFLFGAFVAVALAAVLWRRVLPLVVVLCVVYAVLLRPRRRPDR